MKKIISTILILSLCLSFQACVFAFENNTQDKISKLKSYTYYNKYSLRTSAGTFKYKFKRKKKKNIEKITCHGWEKIYNKDLYKQNLFRSKFTCVKYKAVGNTEKLISKKTKYKYFKVKNFKIVKYKFIIKRNLKTTTDGEAYIYKIKNGKYTSKWVDGKYKYRINWAINFQIKGSLEWTNIT